MWTSKCLNTLLKLTKSVNNACLVLLLSSIALRLPISSVEHETYCLSHALAVDDGVTNCLAASGLQSDDGYIKFVAACKSRPAQLPANDIIDILEGRTQLPVPLRDQINGSIISFRDVVESMPWDDGAWANLALLYGVINAKHLAFQSIQRAITIYPYDASYYVILGVFQERDGRRDDAAGAFSHALLLDPQLLSSRFWADLRIGRPLVATIAVHEATGLAAAVYASTRNPKDGVVLVGLEMYDGKVSQAATILTSVLRNLPTLPVAWELQAAIDERCGNNNGAVMAYKKAIFLLADDPLPHARVALLALEQQDLKTAAEEVSSAVDLQGQLRTGHSMRAAIEYRHTSEALRDDFVFPELLMYITPELHLDLILRAVE
jgi:Flp pilus assembly protein TadD